MRLDRHCFWIGFLGHGDKGVIVIKTWFASVSANQQCKRISPACLYRTPYPSGTICAPLIGGVRWTKFDRPTTLPFWSTSKMTGILISDFVPE